MPTPAELEAEIDTLRLELRDLQDQIPQAIATALRTYADRPSGEKGSPSLQYGVVDGVFDADGWAAVILDGQTQSVPIMMLGGLVEGERVAVLLVPPSGSLAIGMVTPSVVPGALSTQVESFLDGTGVNVTTGGTLPWVVDPGTGATLPSATLLDLSTPTAPVVLADGVFTFDMWVATGGTNCTNARIVYSVSRGVDIALIETTDCPSSAVDTLANAHTFSFSYPCLAGDVVAVTIQNDGTTVRYLLAGSVMSLA